MAQALIILRGQKVLKVGKYDFSLHPESKKLSYTKATDHIPGWRLREKKEKTVQNPFPSKKPSKKKLPKTPAETSTPSADPSKDAKPTIVITDKYSIISNPN